MNWEKEDRITLGELMLSSRASNLLSDYLDDKAKANRFFSVAQVKGKHYTRECKFREPYRSVLVSDFLKHYKNHEFLKVRGVGKTTIQEVCSTLRLFGFKIS